MWSLRVYTDEQLQPFAAAPIMIPKTPGQNQAARANAVVVILKEGGS